MTVFAHLSVLISIVLGLGMVHLLTSLHELVQARRHVRVYWLSATWFVLLFVSLIEWWWASYALNREMKWNFFYFLFLLTSPLSMYLSAAFVLPRVEKGQPVDMRAHYYENSRWMFGLLAVSPALDAVRRGISAGSIDGPGVASNAISAVLLAALATTQKPRYHVLVTLIVGGLFLAFITTSALELR